MIITCRVCGLLAEKSTQTGKLCVECSKSYQREYRKKNYDRLIEKGQERYLRNSQDEDFVKAERIRGRDYWRKLRHEAIMAYGGYVCACCGEDEQKFLTLDHIFNDGNIHRKKLKSRGPKIFKWLKEHGYPSGFQILCMNCNHGKALNNGICPHKTAQQNRVNSGEAQTG